jgi:mono/diheme cytochrome c family protein
MRDSDPRRYAPPRSLVRANRAWPLGSPRLSIRLLAALALVVAGAFSLCGQAFAADAAEVQRGAYLAVAGDCTACHTKEGGKPFAGGLPLQSPFGAIYATNITPSKRFGIGAYSLEQFSRAMRKGVRADGRRLYPAMPYTAYTLMSDADIKALYAYFMTSVAPVEAPAPQSHLPFPFNIRLSMAGWNLLFLKEKRFEADPRESAAWNRGAFLVRGPAHCGDCHTPRNLLMGESGSRDLGGADLGGWYAPNITSDPNSGIGGWSQQELVDYLRVGHAAGKAQTAGPMAEAIDDSLSHLTTPDLNAIAIYLKTVAPVHDRADARPAFAWGGPVNGLDAIRGDPVPADPNAMSGPQLYDAYCASCHNDAGQGATDGYTPSLFHNAALGRTNTNNLVMVMLHGIQRQTNPPAVPMPAFSSLSDRQIAVLGNYVLQTYGNPAARVTDAQVKTLRSGGPASPLVMIVRVAILFGAVLALGVIALIGLRIRARRRAAPFGGRS